MFKEKNKTKKWSSSLHGHSPSHALSICLSASSSFAVIYKRKTIWNNRIVIIHIQMQHNRCSCLYPQFVFYWWRLLT